MILSPLADTAPYHALGPGIAAALEWLAAFDPSLPDGRHEIRGDEVFALVSTYETGPGVEKRFEAHRRHLDVQYVAGGTERILHAPTTGLTVEVPYDDAADVLLFAEPGVSSSVLMGEGDVCILWPGDAHKPGCMAGRREPVRKVVVKVRI